MAKISMPPREPEDYLLGQLSPAERRQFETCLGHSAELRTQVRELEEGLVALAMSAPHHPAPHAAWLNIEAAITRPARWNLWSSLPWFNFKWIATGSGVAASLTTVLLLHVFWQRPAAPPPEVGLGKATINSLRDAPANYSSDAVVGRFETSVSVPAVHNFMAAKGQSSKWQPEIGQPDNQFAAQGQLPPEAAAGSESRLATGGTCGPSGKAKLAPIVQQTMLLASASQSRPGPGSKASVPSTNKRSPIKMQIVRILDFTQPIGDPITPSVPMGTSTSLIVLSSSSDGTTNWIPMLASRPGVTALVNPSTLSANMNPLSVWAVDSDGDWILVGTVGLEGDPIEIILPGLDASDDLQYYYITGGAADTVIGQFPPQ